MTKELTVKEFAALERVEERTVRRWIAKGAVPIRRTPGGGVRVLDQCHGDRLVFVGMTKTDSSGHSSA